VANGRRNSAALWTVALSSRDSLVGPLDPVIDFLDAGCDGSFPGTVAGLANKTGPRIDDPMPEARLDLSHVVFNRPMHHLDGGLI
jgi:hypothetical protein